MLRVYLSLGVASLTLTGAQEEAPETALPPLPKRQQDRGMEMTLFPKPGTQRGIITVYKPKTEKPDEEEEESSYLAQEWRPEEKRSDPASIDYQLPGLEQLGLIPPQPTVTLQMIEFEGNETFADADLENAVVEAIGPYQGKPLTGEDLELARLAVTKQYVAEGYVNSGALIPDQEFTDGKLLMQITEGELSEIRVSRLSPELPIERILVRGNRAISNKELREILKSVLQEKTLPLEQQDVTSALAVVAQYYREKGYVNSGALTPKQIYWCRTLVFPIVEGEFLGEEAAQPTLSGSRFSLLGTEELSEEDLEAAIQENMGEPLGDQITLEQAQAATGALNGYLVENHRESGGAILLHTPGTPDVQLQIHEGRETKPYQRKQLWDRYYVSRLGTVSKGNFNMVKVQKRLELLTLSPLIGRINAEVKPAEELGEAYLELSVKENPAIQGGVDIHNHRPVSVGSGQIDAWYMDQSLFKFGDRLYLTYGALNGGFETGELSEFDNFGVDYRVPINGRDTTLFGSYQQSGYTVIEEPFTALDINGSSTSWSAGIIQPLHRSLKNEVTVTAQLDRLHSETELLGIPFSITPGAVNGEIDLSVFRASLDWVNRSRNHVLAVRLSGATGVDWFDLENTDDGSDLDDQFVLGQFQGQYIRRLGKEDESNVHFLAKGGIQFSDSELLAPLQWTTGGVNTVRGYRENSFVRDMGYFASVELHLPLLYNDADREVLRAIPFFDLGGVWDGGQEVDANQANIYSAGVGGRYMPFPKLELEVFWGYAFEDLDVAENSLQDRGIHAQARFQF